MTPPAIVERAVGVGLHVIAITDHNAAGNAAAVRRAAAGSGLAVLVGMEVETREGVHVLCLFDEMGPLEELQQEVWAHLPTAPNDPALFGEQLLLDERGEMAGSCDRLLLTATGLNLAAVEAQCAAGGGLTIPSHVDRRAYGLLEVLGFLPADLAAPALEVSGRLTEQEARERYPGIAGRPLVWGSDAHCLADIGKCQTLFEIGAASVAELRWAFAGTDGRACRGRAA